MRLKFCQLPEADQPVALFIPYTEKHRLQTGPKRDDIDILIFGMFLIALFQTVIGNALFEMMNMMIAGMILIGILITVRIMCMYRVSA